MNSVEEELNLYDEITQRQQRYLLIFCKSQLINFELNTKAEEESRVTLLRVRLLN
jgi:hypothetical protein